MFEHRILGACLRAPFLFPELRRCDCGSPTWTIELGTPPAPDTVLHPVASENAGGIAITLAGHEGGRGARLEFADTGTFDIAADGRRITWYPAADADMNLVRNDLLGRVLAVAAHGAGILALHASAVLTEAGVIGLIAPKGSGKSTLALALVSRGAKFVSDDVLPIEPGPPPVAQPGVHVMRAHDDTTAYLGEALSSGAQALGGKQLLALDAPELCHDAPAPLAALYELAPAAADATAPVRRPLSSVTGAMRMIGHAKLGPLLAGPYAAEALDRAVRIAASVPVFTLEVPRGFEHLRQASDTILSWHGRPAVQPDPTAAAT